MPTAREMSLAQVRTGRHTDVYDEQSLMTVPPHLVVDDDELRLEMAVGTTRRRLRLTDTAEVFLRDAGYAANDVVPWVVARALVLVGGASLPEGNDARTTAWELNGRDGGSLASEDDMRALADYLRERTVEDAVHDTLAEHVESTGLSRHLDPDDVARRSDTVNRLNDIARDL